MARALQLASRALGTCSPNPAVGAVLVRDGEIVGEGATQPPGQAHAEVVALRAAGPRARGSTLYVTLEPCAHFGRTPPCADAIVGAGVAEAHVAMLDPSPWVNGHGIEALERGGVTVQRGSHEAAARRLNEPYLCWLERGRPLVRGIYALGLDGRPGPLDSSRTGEAALAELARLRATADRTVASIDALLADDPTLTGLAAAGVTALHVEAPPATLAALATRGLLDRLLVFVTPTFSSDGDGLPAEARPDSASLGVQPACLSTLHAIGFERLGDTVLISGALTDGPRAPDTP